MRHNRSQTKQRRSHHALKAPALSVCTNCNAQHLPHHMCLSCGFYKGRQVMDLVAEKAKRTARLAAKSERISAEVGLPTPPAPDHMHDHDHDHDEKPAKEKARAAKGAASERAREESSPHTTKDGI